MTQGRTRRSDPPSPAYIRKIKPSQAVLNALGLHAAAVRRHLLQPLPPPPFPSHIQVPFSVREPPAFSTSCGVTAAAAAPAVIIPVLGRYSLIHSVFRPRLRFCLSNISYIKAPRQPRRCRCATAFYIIPEPFLQKYHEPPRCIAVFFYSLRETTGEEDGIRE